MKSFTRNQPNLLATMQDKRFDALAKKQALEHQHLLSGHNKEMQELRDILKLAIERFESISNRNEQELDEFQAKADFEINLLKERVKKQEDTIASQRKTIEDLYQELRDFEVIYCSKDHVSIMTKDLQTQINHCITGNLNSFQDCQREVKQMVQAVKEDLMKVDYYFDEKFNTLSHATDESLSVAKIDRDSVLKEVRAYKKDIFVIEKKIENIYTLIERINKKGEPCPKQA